MADITRWDPFSEMTSLRRLFDETRPWRLFGAGDGEVETLFPVDLYETGDEVIVEAALPGIKPDDIDVSVTGQALTIRGEHKEAHDEKAQNFYRHERRHGTFVRQIGLPTEVDASKANAEYENGVLHLTLPKAESMKPKSIKIQGKSSSGQPVIEGQSKRTS